MKQTIKKSIAIVFLLLITETTFAATIEKHPEAPVENRFVVGPAKTEVSLAPGETKTVSISVENRMGKRQTFAITFEDFVPSKVEGETITLLGNEKSNTTLKDYLYVSEKEFSLDHGDRIIFPITISIPGNSNPGGKFGSVVVSAVTNKTPLDANDRAYTGAVVLGRIATLVFTTVTGNTTSEGKLISFETKNNKKFFGNGNVETRLTFQNSGNVNLNPYGGIEIKNMFGKVVNKKALDPWYALPGSLRTRDVVISSENMFEKYFATAQINRGYGNVVDEITISFFVLPIGYVILIIVLLVGIGFGIRKFVTRTKVIA